MIEGEYQRPGWDKPCPRLSPNGKPTCEHTASVHGDNGVCSQCAESPAAEFRPCTKPVPEGDRGMDPMLKLFDREVRIVREGHSRMACGRLVYADGDKVELAPIEKPMPHADNGGTFPRSEVKDIAIILDSWREANPTPPHYG